MHVREQLLADKQSDHATYTLNHFEQHQWLDLDRNIFYILHKLSHFLVGLDTVQVITLIVQLTFHPTPSLIKYKLYFAPCTYIPVSDMINQVLFEHKAPSLDNV